MMQRKDDIELMKEAQKRVPPSLADMTPPLSAPEPPLGANKGYVPMMTFEKGSPSSCASPSTFTTTPFNVYDNCIALDFISANMSLFTFSHVQSNFQTFPSDGKTITAMSSIEGFAETCREIIDQHS